MVNKYFNIFMYRKKMFFTFTMQPKSKKLLSVSTPINIKKIQMLGQIALSHVIFVIQNWWILILSLCYELKIKYNFFNIKRLFLITVFRKKIVLLYIFLFFIQSSFNKSSRNWSKLVGDNNQINNRYILLLEFQSFSVFLSRRVIVVAYLS